MNAASQQFVADEIVEGSEELVSAANQPSLVAVILEEFGHFVDAQVNTSDSAGDEGDIFARLVQGESISEPELAVLKAEDDTATIILDGELTQIEQNNLFYVTNNNDSGAGSLRQAIINAGNTLGVDTIDLRGVTGNIALESSLFLGAGNDINFIDDGNTNLLGGIKEVILPVNN